MTIDIQELKNTLETMIKEGTFDQQFPGIQGIFEMVESPNQYHGESTWEHIFMVMEHAVELMPDSDVAKLASLYHDAGKVDTQTWCHKRNRDTFIGHEVESMNIWNMYSDRFNISPGQEKEVEMLCRYHMLPKQPLGRKGMFNLFWAYRTSGCDIERLFEFCVADELGRISEHKSTESIGRIERYYWAWLGWDAVYPTDGSEQEVRKSFYQFYRKEER